MPEVRQDTVGPRLSREQRLDGGEHAGARWARFEPIEIQVSVALFGPGDDHDVVVIDLEVHEIELDAAAQLIAAHGALGGR